MLKIFIPLFLVLFFIFNQVYGQIKGHVIDSNNKGIPYANIALIKKNIGTCSDENGYFTLDINNNIDDTIKMSSIGYASILIPVKSIVSNNELYTVQLKARSYDLKEIVIYSNDKKGKKYKLGLSNSENVGRSVELVGCQTALYMENDLNKTGYIQSVIAYFVFSDTLPVIDVRIRIYECTNELSPGNDLLLDNLIIKPKKGKNIIDVSKYEIYYPSKGVFVAVDFIDSKNVTKGKKLNINPNIGYTYKSNKYLTWNNYRDKGWLLQRRFTSKKGIKGNPMLGIEILSSD